MTEYEAEVLGSLMGTEGSETGLRPLDFGGSSRSHHAQTAIRMVPKGWVERTFGSGWGKPKVNCERGSCRYRITPAGLAAIHNHNALKAAAKSKAAADSAAPR